MRISDPEMLGTFCAFETLFEGSGVKNIRYKGLRKSDTSVAGVGEIYLRCATGQPAQ